MYHEHSSWSAFYILHSLFLLPRFVRPPHPRKLLYLNLGRQPRAAPLILKSCVEEALAGRSVPCSNCYNLGGISNFLACSFLSRHNARAVWGSMIFLRLLFCGHQKVRPELVFSARAKMTQKVKNSGQISMICNGEILEGPTGRVGQEFGHKKRALRAKEIVTGL